MGDFHDWDDSRAELHDADDDALGVERGGRAHPAVLPRPDVVYVPIRGCTSYRA